MTENIKVVYRKYNHTLLLTILSILFTINAFILNSINDNFRLILAEQKAALKATSEHSVEIDNIKSDLMKTWNEIKINETRIEKLEAIVNKKTTYIKDRSDE